MSRVLAIGDIHGCSKALDALLKVVELRGQDLIITLGDYVHRGPDTPGVLQRLVELHQTHQIISLFGNHEELFIQAHEKRREEVPDHHWHFLETVCRDTFEIDSHFFVHANADPDLPIEEQPIYMTRWEKLYGPLGVRRHENGKVMVCGHTAQKSGLPLNLGFAICIDTFCYGGGWLTCLDVKSGRMWQANQRGQTRLGYLPDPEGV